MFRDLRSFLDRLAAEGQLIHYTQQVLPEPDVRGILRAAADLGPSGPAVMIHDIKGYAGEKGGRERPRFLGQPRPDAGHAQDGHSQGAVLRAGAPLGLRTPARLTWVDHAPCQEVVLGTASTCSSFCRSVESTSTTAASTSPRRRWSRRIPTILESVDKENVGIYRIQVLDADTLAMQGLAFPRYRHPHPQGRRTQPRHFRWPCVWAYSPCSVSWPALPSSTTQSEYKYCAALDGEPMLLTKTTDGLSRRAGRGRIRARGRSCSRGCGFPKGPLGSSRAATRGPESR